MSAVLTDHVCLQQCSGGSGRCRRLKGRMTMSHLTWLSGSSVYTRIRRPQYALNSEGLTVQHLLYCVTEMSIQLLYVCPSIKQSER